MLKGGLELVKIFGSMVDKEGRCTHYSSLVDIIANKCYLCKKYYACYQCHDEQELHHFEAWPVATEPDAKVVLCGACQLEMTVSDYQKKAQCLNCGRLFNSNCSKHSDIYFS